MNDVELHRSASELFQRLIDLEKEQREALLIEAGQSEPEVAARARRMLELDQEAGISHPGSDPAGLLGHELGPYEVVELIGTGGMGAVYSARRRAPDETVAIKFLPAFGASAELLARFQYERELLASFKHPGIVGFRNAGKAFDGSLYLAMEFIEGEPLSPRLPAVRESVAKTVDFILGAAAAVQYMHGRATLHRDLKPSNILIRTDGEHPRPVLIDMGIARQLNTGDRDWTGQTMGPVGTPAYMSPEQLQASPDVDVTTDVYGLGAVLFELLCGTPARGLGDLRTWNRAVIERRQAEPARPPSEVVDTECFGAELAAKRARQMRGDLDAIVVKALEYDPADRYPSVEAFSADLRRWLDHRPVVARPISSWGRLRRLMQRKPGATLAVAAAVLVLSITSIVTSISLANERRTRVMLAEQLGTSDRIRRFVQDDVFERAIPELDGPQKPVIELVRGVAQSLGTRLDDAPAVAVGLRSVLLAVLAKMGDLDGAQAQADAGWPLARSLPEDHPQRLEFEIEAARLLEYRYLHVEAEQAMLGLLPRLERARGPAADMRADVLGDLGVALLGQNKLDEAQARLREALELSPVGDPRRYVILANLVQAEGLLNGPAAEVAPTRQLLEELEQRFGPDHVWVMSVATNLCDTLLDLDQPEEALPYGLRALAIAERKFDQDHETRLVILNNIAGCLSKTGKFDEALPLRREVLEGRRALFGDQNLAVGRAALNLATTLHLSGRTSEALEPGEFAAGITRALSGPDHPDTAKAYHTLAVILDALGERQRSIEAFDTALEILARAAGDHDALIARVRRGREAARAGQ